ncbi:MAG: hypothetical protein AAFP15_16480 [Bacteroidota bacterium]
MSDSTFNSCRDAVAYALSHRKGPQAARPSFGGGPKSYRSPWDGSAVRACMHAVGIMPDSPEERALYDWARGGGPKPTGIERKLRAKLDEHGLLKRHDHEQVNPLPRESLELVEWEDPDTGATIQTVTTRRER